jgi:two-component system OmpR family sensor kinase
MRGPRTLSSRLLLGFGALFAITLGAVVTLSIFIANEQLPHSLDDQLRAIADQAEERIESGSTPRSTIDELATAALYIEVTDASGNVTHTSRNLGARTLPTYLRPGIQSPGDGLHTTSFFRSQLRLLRHAMFDNDGNLTGYVVVGGVVSGVSEEALDLGLIIGSVAAGGLILVLAGAFWFARRETAPLRDLTEAVRATAASGFEQPIPESTSGSTEARELRAAFSELVERQRQLMMRERAFFADSSHVLRTPLAVVRGDVELLEQGAYGKERQEAVAQARAAIDAMSRTVSGLLLLSRDRDDPPAGWEVVELGSLLAQVVREARVAFPGLVVEFVGSSPVEVAGDPVQLRDLFTSLVENACHYTPEAGAVRVTLSESGELNGAGPSAIIAISDSGIGFSGEDLSHATDRFYRGRQARRMFPAGSGLGLAIAARIVDLHRGSLELGASEGGGAKVIVKLTALSAN